MNILYTYYLFYNCYIFMLLHGIFAYLSFDHILCISYTLFPNALKCIHEIELNILWSKIYMQYLHKTLVHPIIILRKLTLSCFCATFYILTLQQMSLFHYNSYILKGRKHKGSRFPWPFANMPLILLGTLMCHLALY